MSNEEFAEQFRQRTKEFVIRSTRPYRALPKTGEAKIFGDQFLRASSLIAANYRAACRARSPEEFFSKLSIVVEEADEACFWLEIIISTEILPQNKVESLLSEGYEILSVVSAARKNTPSKSNKKFQPKTH